MTNATDIPCGDCGEKATIMYMHSQCHMGSPTWTYIDMEKNVAIVICAECNKEIITLALAVKE